MQQRSEIDEDPGMDLARVAIHTLAALRRPVRAQGSGWDLEVLPPTQLDADEQPDFAPPTREVLSQLHTGLLKLIKP
jgi:hypothetical protein